MEEQSEAEQYLRKLSQKTESMGNWQDKSKYQEPKTRFSIVRIQSKHDQKYKLTHKYKYHQDQPIVDCQEASEANMLHQIAFPIICGRKFNEEYQYETVDSRRCSENQLRADKKRLMKTEQQQKGMDKIIQVQLRKMNEGFVTKLQVNQQQKKSTNHIQDMKETFIRNMRVKNKQKQKSNEAKSKPSPIKIEPIGEVKRVLNINFRKRSLSHLPINNYFSRQL